MNKDKNEMEKSLILDDANKCNGCRYWFLSEPSHICNRCKALFSEISEQSNQEH